MTGGISTQLSSAYWRCSLLFEDTIGQLDSSNHYPLNNVATSLSRQFDSGAGAGSYNITFTNKNEQVQIDKVLQKLETMLDLPE